MIVSTRAGGEVELRDASVGALIRATEGLRSGKTGVTRETVLGLPAWMAAVTIASQAVASMRQIAVFRGEGPERRQVRTTWQARFFGSVPNDRGESWFSLLAQTEASLTNANNAYWLKLSDQGRVGYVAVAAPEAVEVRWHPEAQVKLFRVRLDDGHYTDWLDSSYVLHFRRLNLPGCLKDPSPVDLHRQTLAAALAKVSYEANYYDEGILRGLAVTFPREMQPDEAQRWREVFQASHSGTDRQHQVRVFGGGAEVSTIGLSLEEAQYIESMQFSIQDVARMTGVQASLLGAAAVSTQASAPLSPEHEQDRWLRYGLGPRLTLIEETVKADPSFFGPGSRDYPLFPDRAVHGDIKTETDRIHKLVQAGVLLQDEARALLGYDPLPDGVGQIPQIVPVGGAPNPEPAQAARPQLRVDVEPLPVHVRVEPQVTFELPEERQPVIVNLPEQQPPTVNVNVPEQPTPVVNVALPEQPAPEVHVSVDPTPVEVTVTPEPPVIQNDVTVETPPRAVQIVRDAMGRIVGATSEDL